MSEPSCGWPATTAEVFFSGMTCFGGGRLCPPAALPDGISPLPLETLLRYGARPLVAAEPDSLFVPGTPPPGIVSPDAIDGLQQAALRGMGAEVVSVHEYAALVCPGWVAARAGHHTYLYYDAGGRLCARSQGLFHTPPDSGKRVALIHSRVTVFVEDGSLAAGLDRWFLAGEGCASRELEAARRLLAAGARVRPGALRAFLEGRAGSASDEWRALLAAAVAD